MQSSLKNHYWPQWNLTIKGSCQSVKKLRNNILFAWHNIKAWGQLATSGQKIEYMVVLSYFCRWWYSTDDEAQISLSNHWRHGLGQGDSTWSKFLCSMKPSIDFSLLIPLLKPPSVLSTQLSSNEFINHPSQTLYKLGTACCTWRASL